MSGGRSDSGAPIMDPTSSRIWVREQRDTTAIPTVYHAVRLTCVLLAPEVDSGYMRFQLFELPRVHRPTFVTGAPKSRRPRRRGVWHPQRVHVVVVEIMQTRDIVLRLVVSRPASTPVHVFRDNIVRRNCTP